MANALTYKNIGIEDESSWGASTAGTAHRLQVTSVSINQVKEKQLVEDTIATPKGRDRMRDIKDTYEGDISGYLTPRNAHHMLELVNGSPSVAGGSIGSSATLFSYPQNTSGIMSSKTMVLDRNNSSEKFQGVRGKSFEISFSDSLMEFTLNGMASNRISAAALVDVVGETIKPFTFADAAVSIHAGSSYGANPVTLNVSEMSITYDNGLETTHLSGSGTPNRSDPKVPTIEGKFKIFHDGTSWTSAAYGSSEFYIRVLATLPSQGGYITGTTPFRLRIDIPRTELTSTVRDYEQGEFSMEEIEFMGMVEPGLSTLWRVELEAGVSID